MGSPPQSGYSGPFVHPGLTVALDPAKGRKVVTSRPLRDGETVLVDEPYALVPAMLADDPPFLLCSRHGCSRRIQPKRVPVDVDHVGCPQRCIDEVAWCGVTCRQKDEARHSLECSWLQRRAAGIRERHGDAGFGLVWLIARILIQRHVGGHGDAVQGPAEALARCKQDFVSHFRQKGWDAVMNLEGHENTFPAEHVELWRRLAKELPGREEPGFDVDSHLVDRLFCKLETNSFGLYPGITGEYPVVSFTSRGNYYGAGIYPTAAMFNHACCPNIIHKVDDNGRRTFEANRDIGPGEECCISYFDLVEFPDTKARQEEMARSWNFMCNCQRCEDEGEFEMPHFLKEMEF